MAGKKISILPAIPSCQLTDLIPEVQPALAGITYKATLQQLLTLFQSAGTIPYTEVLGVSQLMAPNNGYIASNLAQVTLTLPAVIPIGARFEICGKGAGGWRIAQQAVPAQQIQIGSLATTAGAAGSVSSANQWDSLILVCVTANTLLVSLGSPQSAGLIIV